MTEREMLESVIGLPGQFDVENWLPSCVGNSGVVLPGFAAVPQASAQILTSEPRLELPFHFVVLVHVPLLPFVAVPLSSRSLVSPLDSLPPFFSSLA